MKKRFLISYFFFLLSSCLSIFALPFNKNLKAEEQEQIENGQFIIRNIVYSKYMCLDSDYNDLSKQLCQTIKKLQPKYLAESILILPKKNNENLQEKLNELLYNVSDYAGIPYYSERNKNWYNLYDAAKITSEEQYGNTECLKAILTMSPFGDVYEDIEITKDQNNLLYVTTNTNKLRYFDEFDCVWPEKMKMCILLLDDGDQWVLYGIGGVNAPRIPFFTERIQTSFINRINTFCSFIFNKLS